MPAKKTDVKYDGLQRHDGDTGSPEVQISMLTEQITQLQSHLNLHKQDHDAKRSLLKKVAKRRTFMKYLKGKNLDAYLATAKKLGLKAA